jgi:hypothetical protein
MVSRKRLIVVKNCHNNHSQSAFPGKEEGTAKHNIGEEIGGDGDGSIARTTPCHTKS